MFRIIVFKRIMLRNIWNREFLMLVKNRFCCIMLKINVLSVVLIIEL